MSLEDIVIYKDYQIILIKGHLMDEYVNGYVYLERLQETPFSNKEFGNETYREGNVIGVDTLHYYNQKMSYEEKKEDAIRQIKIIIDEYVDLIKVD